MSNSLLVSPLIQGVGAMTLQVNNTPDKYPEGTILLWDTEHEVEVPGVGRAIQQSNNVLLYEDTCESLLEWLVSGDSLEWTSTSMYEYCPIEGNTEFVQRWYTQYTISRVGEYVHVALDNLLVPQDIGVAIYDPGELAEFIERSLM